MATTVEKVYKLEVQGTDSINDLKSAIEQLTEKLKTLDEQSKEYLDTLEKITEYQEKLADAMSSISDSVESVSETVSNSIEEIGDTISSVGDALNNIGDVDTNVVDAFVEGFVDGLNEAQQSVDGLSEKVSGVTVGFEELNNEAEKTSETLNNLGGATTVKELKQEISDLRDRLVNLDKGSDEYKATVQELINSQVKLKEVMNAGKNEMEAAEGSYNALSQRMSALKQVWKEATDEATRDEIGRQIAEINNQLKGMDASIGNFQRNVGNYKSALDGLDGSFVNLKTQLKECKEAMQQLDPSSQAYADAMARAAEITHQLAEQQEQIKYASPDLGDQLNNIRGIASNMAAGFGAVNAAMGLFGEKNEEVQQAMLKVQQAMALVQGLQGMDGFIKRTQGLSQSLGLATKATKANTTATNANATATKADAAAKTAEGVATNSAIAPQLSLNAAMKANPIGFIIGLIAALVTAYSLLKDKIMELIGANDNMSNAFNKVKAILAGFGNVIKKSVIGPVTMAITPIKTLAKMMIDLFSGDWSKIGDDFKEGMNEMKDAAINTMNVVGNFKEGYDKKTESLNNEARKKEAAARQKELDDVIKDNEAKYGSDWKYTQKGKKAYESYFNALTEMYDKNTDEYKQAVRDKMTYDREYAQNAAKAELEYKKALYGDSYEFSDEWHQKVLDGLEDAKKEYNSALKAFNESKQKVIEDFCKELGLDPNDPTIAIGINIKAYFPEAYEKLEELKAFLDEQEKNVKVYEKRLDDYNKAQAKKRLDEYKNTLNDIKSSFENFVPNLTRVQWNYDDLIAKWEKSINTYKSYLKNTRKLTDEEIDNIVTQIREKIVKNNLFGSWAKQLREEYEKEFNNWDRDVSNWLSKENDKFEEIKLTIGIETPEESLRHLNDVFEAQGKNIRKEIKEINDYIEQYRDKINSVTDDYANYTDEQLGLEIPEFQKMLDKKIELEGKYTQLRIDNFKAASEVIKEAYEMEESREKTYYENRLSQMELSYNKEEALIEKRNEKFDTGNEIEAIKRQMEYENEYYTTTIDMYNNLRDRYYQMSKDMTLTAEERKNAEIEAAKITGQIIEEELNHETQLLKKQKDLIKSWKDAVTNSISGVVDIMSTIGDAWSSMIDLEKNAIQSELEEGKISQEEADRREEQNKKSFESLKSFQIAQAIINTLAAAVSAYQSMASIPYVGPVLGGVAAAAALAAGYAQVRQIQATEYGSSSSSSKSSGGSTTFQLPDVMEYEPELGRNITNMSDTDELNNGGRGRGESETRVYVVESDISNALDKSNKRRTEVTF